MLSYTADAATTKVSAAGKSDEAECLAERCCKSLWMDTVGLTRLWPDARRAVGLEPISTALLQMQTAVLLPIMTQKPDKTPILKYPPVDSRTTLFSADEMGCQKKLPLGKDTGLTEEPKLLINSDYSGFESYASHFFKGKHTNPCSQATWLTKVSGIICRLDRLLGHILEVGVGDRIRLGDLGAILRVTLTQGRPPAACNRGIAGSLPLCILLLPISLGFNLRIPFCQPAGARQL